MNGRSYTFMGQDYDAVWSWGEEKTALVEIAINNWMRDNEIFCSETVMQSDRGLIGSPELVSEILEILQVKVTDKDIPIGELS